MPSGPASGYSTDAGGSAERSKNTLGAPTSPGLATLITSTRRARCSETRSEEHTSELQSLRHLVCRLLLEKKKKKNQKKPINRTKLRPLNKTCTCDATQSTSKLQ